MLTIALCGAWNLDILHSPSEVAVAQTAPVSWNLNALGDSLPAWNLAALDGPCDGCACKECTCSNGECKAAKVAKTEPVKPVVTPSAPLIEYAEVPRVTFVPNPYGGGRWVRQSFYEQSPCASGRCR